MTGRVAAGGIELAYDEAGSESPPVVLVHGTAATHAVWQETRAQLPPERRAIAYDRRAYGDSGAPEPYGGTTVGEQADDLADVIEALGAAPAVVCGHELGALACLDLLARHARLVEKLVLVEPPMLWLTPDGPDAVGELRDAVERGAREGGAPGAVTGYLEHVAGAGVHDLLGATRIEAARANPRAFAADVAAAASWPAGRRELRELNANVTVISGERSAPVRRRAAEALVDLLPDATLVLAPAGHLVHVEAPQPVSAACV